MVRFSAGLVLAVATAACNGVGSTAASLIEGDHYVIRGGQVSWVNWSSMGGPPTRVEIPLDAEAASFEILGDPVYGRDGETVFCEGKPLSEAQSATFHILRKKGEGDRTYATDGRGVWTGCELIPEAEGQSFEPLAGAYARDEDTVFNWKWPIEGADAGSFRVFSSNAEYAVDRNGVWIGPFLIDGADTETFRLIDAGYATDGRAIFWRQYKVEGADVESFHVPKGMSFGQDMNGCWTGSQLTKCLAPSQKDK